MGTLHKIRRKIRMFLEELKDSLDGLLELMDEDNEYGEYKFSNLYGDGEISLDYCIDTGIMTVEAEYDDEYKKKSFTCDHKGLLKCVSFVRNIMDSIAY
jgi:hypothetical protein